MNSAPKIYLSKRLRWDKWWPLIVLASSLAAVLLLLAHRFSIPHAQSVLGKVSVAFFLVVILCYLLSHAVPSTVAAEPSAGIELVLAFVLGAASYAPALGIYFFCDDYAHLAFAHGNFLPDAADSFRHGLPLNHLLYRPFAFAAVAAQAHLFRSWAPGYHLISLLLHLMVAGGLFSLCRQLGFSARLASAAGVFFAVLPIHVEPVAWLSTQYDLWATVLVTWAAVFYLRYLQDRRSRDYVLSLLLFSLAMGSKETAFVFPLLLGALHLFVINRGGAFVSTHRSFPALAGTFAVGFVGFINRWLIIGGLGGYSDSAGRSYTLQFDHTLSGLLRLAPTAELFGFNWLQPERRSVLLLLACLTASALLSLAILSKPMRNGVVPFALAWILVALLPTHALLYIGPGLTNSRFLYLSSAGLCILLAALLQGLHGRWTQNLITLLLLISFSFSTLHNLRAWRYASDEVKSFQAQLLRLEPNPPASAVLSFQGLPDSERGVYVFAAGFDAMIQSLYRRTDLNAARVSDPIQFGGPGPILRFRWNQQTQTLTAQP